MSQRNDRELATEVMQLIDIGHRRISRAVDLTRLQVMGLIAARGPLRPSAIVKELDMTASAVSRHLTALQDSGTVTVDSDPADDRTFLVRIGGPGSNDMAAALTAGTDRFVAVVADWSDHDIAEATRLVRKLLDSWEQPAPTPPATASGPGRSGPNRRRRKRTAAGPDHIRPQERST